MENTIKVQKQTLADLQELSSNSLAQNHQKEEKQALTQAVLWISNDNKKNEDPYIITSQIEKLEQRLGKKRK